MSHLRHSHRIGDRVHSFGTLRTEMKATIEVYKAIKAHEGTRVKHPSDVTSTMIQAQFERDRRAGLPGNTLLARQIALRWLESLIKRKRMR